MSLSDLASLGSFVSGFAVLVSLIYLALQVRQAEKNQRAIIHQGRTQQSVERLLRSAEPTFTRTVLKMTMGREPLPEEIEFQQLLMLSFATFREMQDAYFQRDIGLLDDAALTNQLSPLRAMLRTASGKALWRTVREAYEPHFVERMNALDQSLPVRPLGWALERYKAELAKMTAT